LYVLFRIGDYVTLGGRVAVRDHVSIVSKVLIW
jgi:UDP-3-O-[3-hydroxymyristoyl] glucosamine N-acyltransferase